MYQLHVCYISYGYMISQLPYISIPASVLSTDPDVVLSKRSPFLPPPHPRWTPSPDSCVMVMEFLLIIR